VSKLAEYVDAAIDDEDIEDQGWFPHGWLKTKGGPVHVQDVDAKPGVALCGDEANDQVIHEGPARVLLRRSAPCKKCEAKV